MTTLDNGDNMKAMVSIIVVSFNTREMTLECLRSVKAETKVPYELIVIDNDSSDGSAEAIAAEFPEVKLMAETDNHGFAKANNIAGQVATGEYILLLNPDTVILDGAIDNLIDFAREKPAAKIWGGCTLYGDRSMNRTSCFQRMTLWTVFCRATGIAAVMNNHSAVSEAFGEWAMDTVRAVDVITGCFLLIPRKLWNDLGGFNLDYFMYGEEADLCMRAKRDYGADPHYTPHAVIIHYGGASEPIRADKMVRLYKSKLTIIQHHFKSWQKPVAGFLWRSIPFSRLLILSVVAKLTGRESFKRSAGVWGDIWKRRSEWIGGADAPRT